MIVWQDFYLDDVVGPTLLIPHDRHTSCRDGMRLGCPDARNGASGENQEGGSAALIQETGQEKRLARMAGHSSHESIDPVGRMLAGSDRAENSKKLRQGGKA